MNLREEVPVNVVKGANLETTMNDLYNNFKSGEERNAQLINEFLGEAFFRGEESLINKLIEVKPTIDFDEIKDEGINLGLLLYDKWMWDFKNCLDKITIDEIKQAIIQEIFNKIQAEIGLAAPYTDFPTACSVPIGGTSPNVLGYFQKVIRYLEGKEGSTGAKKVERILPKIIIKNEDINVRLAGTGYEIPSTVPLSDTSIPSNSKNAFDVLLAFEIGKEADRVVQITNSISEKLDDLFINSFPAVNTIISENADYKYDESKLGDEYNTKLQAINNDTNLSDDDKNKRINELRREYYLKYLKSKNANIGNALQQLYDNNFDYSKIDSTVLTGYLEKVANLRMKKLFDSGVKDALKLDFGNLHEFEDFYRKLADPTVNSIQLDAMRAGMSLPVEKSITEGENLRLKDINQYGSKAKPYDSLPINYKIKKTDINALPIDIEDKAKILSLMYKYKTDEENYIIDGGNIGSLIYLFFVVNSRMPITKIDPDKQKNVENLFGRTKNHNSQGEEENENGNNPNHPSNPDDNPGDSNEENEEDKISRFKQYFETTGQGKFENGSEIRLPMAESELPGGGYQRMKVKISNVDFNKGTFTGKVFGGELKFKNLEGKSRTFKMDDETIQSLKNLSKDSSKIRLLPNPDNSDFNTFVTKLNNKLGNNSLNFPPEGVNWDGSKFSRKILDDEGKEKEEVVKYFGSINDDKSTYKVEYNPIRRSFTVSSIFNGDEKDKNGKSKKIRFSYKRDMDWNNFLIFFTQKGLTPQSEEESNDAINRQNNEFKMVNGGHRSLNWFSINNLKNGFKDIIGAIKKNIDKYDKEQTEKFKGIVESPILNALSKIPLPPSVKYAIGERQQEIYNERDSAVWKKIEGYLKVFQADPDFGTTFENIPPHIKTQGGMSLKEKVLSRVQNANDRMGDPGIYQAAALLLANIEKGGSPYRGLAGNENSGLWVKALLGKAHYEQFMRDKQACINDLKKAGSEKAQIQDVLATCEMDYIINNVSGANGKLKYFGCHEGRGIPGENGTDYVDNPSKRILSNQFADKLKGAYKGWFNKSSVEESFGKISHNDFQLAKEDFKRLIKSSRFPGALGNLKKMFLLASNDAQKAEYQKCFLIYMLSGILDFNGKKDLRKQTYLWAKTMGFLPGMLAKNTGHSEQVAKLLDDWSGGDFSNHVKSYFREKDLKNGPVKIGKLIEELDGWWSVDKMKDFEDYSKSKFPTKSFPENSVLRDLQKSALKTDMENMDNSLLDNPLVANSGGLLSNANVVRDRMAIRDGSFDGKDPDERNNRAEFWKQIAKEVSNMNENDAESVNLVLNQYFSRFGMNSEVDRQKAYKRIKTAYYWKGNIGKRVKYDFNGKGQGQDLDMGIISTEEINDILWYTFQGTTWRDCFSARKLPSQMEDALKAFQKFFQKAFESGKLNDPIVVKKAFKADGINVEPMLLGSRNLYKEVLSGDNENSWDDTEIGDETDAFNDPKKRRKALKRAFQSGRFINYEIAQIERSFKNRLPAGSYRVITQDTSSDINTRIKLLDAA